MFRWIIGTSLKYRYLVIAATMALFMFGIDKLRTLPLDVFPEFAPPRIEIQTEGPGLSVLEIEELLKLAIEGRKRVKDQLMRIDATYPDVDFSYEKRDGSAVKVKTLEETEHPAFYFRQRKTNSDKNAAHQSSDDKNFDISKQPVFETKNSKKPNEGHRVFVENQKGVTYDTLFGPYLGGAHKITITDPYIRLFYQAKNVMEFIETVVNIAFQD